MLTKWQAFRRGQLLISVTVPWIFYVIPSVWHILIILVTGWKSLFQRLPLTTEAKVAPSPATLSPLSCFILFTALISKWNGVIFSKRKGPLSCKLLYSQHLEHCGPHRGARCVFTEESVRVTLLIMRFLSAGPWRHSRKACSQQVFCAVRWLAFQLWYLHLRSRGQAPPSILDEDGGGRGQGGVVRGEEEFIFGNLGFLGWLAMLVILPRHFRGTLASSSI